MDIETDGPAQNATSSNDFEMAFVRQRCCLLVSDHGNEMVRPINLKEEDCLESSHSNLGTYSLWSIRIALSCFLEVAIGIALCLYIIRHKLLIVKRLIKAGFVSILSNFLLSLELFAGSKAAAVPPVALPHAFLNNGVS